MTVEEIKALIVINEEAEAVLRDDLKEAISKVEIELFFAAVILIKDDFDNTNITANKARHELEKLSI